MNGESLSDLQFGNTGLPPTLISDPKKQRVSERVDTKGGHSHTRTHSEALK